MSGKCPTDGALIRLSMNETSPRESEKLARHLVSCSRCSLRFDVLRQVKKDLRPNVEIFSREFSAAAAAGPLLASAARKKLQEFTPDRPIAPPRPRSFGVHFALRFATGFLAVLAVVAVGIYLTGARAIKYSDLRSPAVNPTLIEPIGAISVAPGVFRWSPVQGADEYLFELYDESLERVHVGSTFLINELVLPAGITAKLVRGWTYLWSISALDGDSNLLTSRSGSFIIE